MIHERHRHRYEFNCLYEQALTDKGWRSSAARSTASSSRSWSCRHPWYVAVQFHPEFKSKPLKPHPLFAGFVDASYRHKIAARAAAGRVRGRVSGVTPISVRRADGRRAALAAPHRRAVRHRERSARRRPRRLRSATSPAAPACRTSSRRRTTRRTAPPARPSAGPGSTTACACSRACARGAGVPILTDIHEPAQAARGGRGRRRAADSRLPVAADRSDRRRGADRARGEHQEGTVPRAARHAARDREGDRRGQHAGARHRARVQRSATTTSWSTCARSRCCARSATRCLRRDAQPAAAGRRRRRDRRARPSSSSRWRLRRRRRPAWTACSWKCTRTRQAKSDAQNALALDRLEPLLRRRVHRAIARECRARSRPDARNG